MTHMEDDFAEFETTASEILQGLEVGTPVTFGFSPKIFICASKLPLADWPAANGRTTSNESGVQLIHADA